jgi:hypothetical protein
MDFLSLSSLNSSALWTRIETLVLPQFFVKLFDKHWETLSPVIQENDDSIQD